MTPITTNNLQQIINNIVNTEKVDVSLIPQNPMIFFYDDKDNKFYSDNTENAFYAIMYMICKNHLQGYYCTVETDWYDDEDTYQGNVGKRNYTKYYFNDDDSCLMDRWNDEVFGFPFRILTALNTISK